MATVSGVGGSTRIHILATVSGRTRGKQRQRHADGFRIIYLQSRPVRRALIWKDGAHVRTQQIGALPLLPRLVNVRSPSLAPNQWDTTFSWQFPTVIRVCRRPARQGPCLLLRNLLVAGCGRGANMSIYWATVSGDLINSQQQQLVGSKSKTTIWGTLTCTTS